MTIKVNSTKNRRSVVAWALYDWANSAFAVVVLAGFYPLFFRQYWAQGQNSEDITFYLGLANSVSSLIIVLAAPMLGAIADRASLRKELLTLFALLGISMTTSLFWVGQGQWELAALLFTASSIGFMGGNVFYDSLMVNVAEPRDYDRVSALGFGLGYLGSGLLFSFCVYMTINPGLFGLEDASAAVKTSFLLTGLWWALFSLPLLLWVEDSQPANTVKLNLLKATQAGFIQLAETFKHIRTLRPVWLFLLAYWLYIDGVDTVIRMAVDYGKALGFNNQDLIKALLITQFVGFPAAIAFGWLGGKIGTRNGLFLGIAAYVIITAWASRMDTSEEFYGLAIFVGLAQGGIQSLSRSFYAKLIPADKAGEFFGFYNMLGKFAAVLGPLMVGWVGVLTGNPRTGLLSLLVLFIAGGLVLSRVQPPKPA